MDCLICGASARKLGTNFHGDIYDCVECGSFVVSADVLKERKSLGRVMSVEQTRLWLISQRLANKHRPVINAGNVRWER